MINRRHIRIKVMQSIYALLQSKNETPDTEAKFLYSSIDKLFDLYATVLQLLIEVRNYERKHITVSRKKYLATAEELNPNTKFIDNQIFEILEKSSSLKEYVAKNKLNFWELDSEFVQETWKGIKEDDQYKRYMSNGRSGFDEDKSLLIEVYKSVIAPNEKLADYFEDKNISWVDDIPFVNTWIVKTLGQMKPDRNFNLGNIYKDDDDKKFVIDLFRTVVQNHNDYEKFVMDKTPNWDTDRIAGLDLILIKMAICEFLKFPSIPTRVTINEYIEIAKDYSTEKSSFFINGVLDKILKEFTASKSLNKIGRGLL